MSWHGTVSGYTYHRCRCVPCKAAAREYKKSYRAGPGGEVERTYSKQYSPGREIRRRWNIRPVTTMPYYRFLAERGYTF